MHDVQINEVESHKHLGVVLFNDGTSHEHVIVSKRIWIMKTLKFVLDRKSLETIYLSFIQPLLKYSDAVLSNITHQEDFEEN